METRYVYVVTSEDWHGVDTVEEVFWNLSDAETFIQKRKKEEKKYPEAHRSRKFDYLKKKLNGFNESDKSRKVFSH